MVILKLLRLALWPNTFSILENVPHGFENNIYSAVWGWNICYISLNVSLKTNVSLLIFFLDELSIDVKVPYYYITVNLKIYWLYLFMLVP